METLRHTETLVIWKTKDEIWTHTLKREDFHQLLCLDKDTKSNNLGHKNKGWWRKGDIKVSQKTRKYSNVG